MRLCGARRDNVTQKTSNTKSRQAATSKSLKPNAGPTVIQRMLNQNLRKAVIYENKWRPAARGHSQATVSER